MGYNTTYTGKLKLIATIEGLKRLKSILGEDVRDHKEFGQYKGKFDPKDAYWHHVDLELDEDFDLVWDRDSEKSYVCADMINAIIAYVREVDPGFQIYGDLDAYGEEAGDIWRLSVTREKGARRVDPEAQRKQVEKALKELLEAADDVLGYHGIVNLHCPPPEFARLELAKRAVQELL